MLAWLRTLLTHDTQLVVTFTNAEVRQHFRRLCLEMGRDEQEVASRLLTQFIGYCENSRPKKEAPR